MLKLKGKIFEIGNLEDGSGRGMRLECDGDDFAIIGMTEDECRAAARWFGDDVEITIVGNGTTATDTQDAARYRWLREKISDDMQWYMLDKTVDGPKAFDIAVDAAMLKTPNRDS